MFWIPRLLPRYVVLVLRIEVSTGMLDAAMSIIRESGRKTNERMKGDV